MHGCALFDFDFEVTNQEEVKRVNVLRILTCEESRIFRIWDWKQEKSRVVSKHNDIVVRVLKIPGRNMFVSCSKDGSIKCFHGKSIELNNI